MAGSGKVLLIVIDAATAHVVCPAIRTGRLATMRRLLEAGRMHEASCSIFPSITPAATSSIITGAYPAEHGIAGASWFDEATQTVAYYGDDFWTIAREGFGNFIRDFLLHLNGDRLRAPTMFQMVERAGRTAACLNYLVFRGDVPHTVNIPALMAAVPGVPLRETVEGPSILSLGDFVGPRVAHGRRLHEKAGLLHRFGMDDASTGAMLRDLVQQGPLPDFTVAYFADNDFRGHEVGPFAALPAVEEIDRMLGDAFDAAGGLERFLADTTVLITGDHGHCDVVADPERAVIRLDAVLSNYRQARFGRAWRAQDQIMICPNMRAAQIYLQEPTADLADQIASDLLRDDRVEQVMWRNGLARDGAAGYTVRSRGGELQFGRYAAGAEGPATPTGGHAVVDACGGTWCWAGDPGPLGLEHDRNEVVFSEFPNAFERIAGVLDLDASGDIWVTATPGCEFEVAGGRAHVGGASHGALHKLDSNSLLLVSGGDTTLPRHLRSIDIAPLCMRLLGIPMRYRVGESRAAALR